MSRRSKAITQYDIIDRISKVNTSCQNLIAMLELYKHSYNDDDPKIAELNNLLAQIREIAVEVFSEIKLDIGSIENDDQI